MNYPFSHSIAAVGLIVSVVGLSSFDSRNRDAAEHSLATTVFIEPSSTFTCGNCMTCVSGHKVPTLKSEKGDLDNPHNFCMTLAHCNGHPGCQSFAGLGEYDDALVVAAAEGDIESAKMLLTRMPAKAHFNRKRSAIQIAGSCDPSFVAIHIPVDGMALAASLEQGGLVQRSDEGGPALESDR